ncbi:MAG: RDD family protein [Nanobdellota archaeon]
MKKRRKPFVSSPLAKRSFAFIIDVLLLDIVVMRPFHILLLKVLPSQSFSGIMETAGMPIMYVTIFFWSLFGFAYFVLLEYSIGQTVGKILFDLHVKSLKGQVSLFQAMVRSMFVFPIFPFTLLWIADPLLLAFKGKRASEYISNTYTR